MKLCSLASGSTGNSSYLIHKNSRFLIDVGISKKAIETELSDLKEKAEDISGIFITHEHIDHIKGLGPFIRAYKVPVYLTKGTYDVLKEYKSLGVVDSGLFNVLKPGYDYRIGDLLVHAISTNHDAAEPVGYRFSADGKSMAVITDLGAFTEDQVNKLKMVDACILEANHDIRMLEMGPYPYKLKLRILGKDGHLCNDDCLKLINILAAYNLKKVILGHLSKENNLPEIAYETVMQGLNEENKPHVLVAAPKGHSEWIKV